MALPTPPLLKYLESAIEVAQEAGELIRKAYHSPSNTASEPVDASTGSTPGVESDTVGTGMSVQIKEGNATDLVTETDQECEKLVFGRLKAMWPDCRFIGEESVAEGRKSELTDDPTWIVDPIDGTTNFVHGNPDTCIAIGLTIGKEPVVGVVYNPITEEIYTAAKSHGAHLNRTTSLPINRRGAAPSHLSGALVATEYGSDRNPDVLRSKAETMRRFAAQKSDGGAQVHGIRCTGSAAMDMCQVARGGVDLYWEIGVHCWDIAAATVIVRESGGRVVTCRGKYNGKSVVESGESGELDLLGRKVMCVRQGKGTDMKGLLEEAMGLVEDINVERD